MSKRNDVIEGTETSARNGLIYTCRAGWIDLGHARPDNVRDNLWNKLKKEEGMMAKDKQGYKLTFSETCYNIKTLGKSVDYYVRYGLTLSQMESVALAIFMEVSLQFEAWQDMFRIIGKDSGFSAEDLVSDILGFYRAVRPDIEYIKALKPVSKEAALKIWDTYGAVGDKKNKNQSFNPYLYPCEECPTAYHTGSPACGIMPKELSAIEPAKIGKFFRYWQTDWYNSDDPDIGSNYWDEAKLGGFVNY